MVVSSLPFPKLGRVAFARFMIVDIGYSFVVLNFVFFPLWWSIV
jgi:hypothetical protein